MRKAGAGTRFPGVQRLGPRTFRIRFKMRDPRTGLSREVDRVIEGPTTPEEAAKVRAELRIQERASDRPGSRRIRVRDCAASWLASKLPTLKASTRRTYTDVLANHVEPALGNYFLDALTPGDIVKWRDSMNARPATVNGRLRVLKTFLGDVCGDRDIPSPAARVKAIREPHMEGPPRSVTAEELGALFVALREHEPQWWPLCATLAMTGLRFGEATALRWSDIDEKRGMILVRRSQWRGYVDGTKTGDVRDVPLPRELADILKQYRRMLVADQRPGINTGYIFVNEAGKLPSTTASLRKPIARAMAAAGLSRRLTVHGFRHTLNNLVRQSASGEVARSITGHMTAEMTIHYSHVSRAEKQAAVNAALAPVLGLVPTTQGKSGDKSGDRNVSG